MLSRSIERVRVALLVACLSTGGMTSAQVLPTVQPATGTISGVATDETGAAVPDVRVMVTNDATALRREVTTGAEGTFTLPMLSPGQYTLRAERTGFAPHELPGITVSANDQVTVRVQLKVASFAEGVVVTAQRRGEERVQDVPVPVTVVDPRLLEDTNKTRLRDFFELVPGFNGAPTSFGRSTLSIRGVSPLGGAPTVGVAIDDIPFGLSGGAQAGTLPEIDPGDLQRVEVLRGPQGTLYGAGSMGGLVKYVTAEPSPDRITGRLQTGTSHVYNGSTPGLNLRGAFNLPLASHLAVRVSGFVRQDSGYIDNPVTGIDGINQSRTFGGRVSALWRPSSQTSLNISAIYQSFKRNGLDEETMAAPGFDQTAGLGPLQQNYVSGTGGDRLSIQNYSAILKSRVGVLDVTALTGYNTLDLDWSVDLVPLFDAAFVDPLFPGQGSVLLPYFQADRQSKFSQELRVGAKLGRLVDILLGGFYTHEDSPSHFHVPARRVDGRTVGVFWDLDQPQSSLDEYSVFGTLNAHLTDRLTIQLGARQSYFKQHLGEIVETGALYGASPNISPALSGKEDAFTYLVTPQFKASDNLLLYTRFTSGYRPGRPNSALPDVPRQPKPDKTQNYEAGIKTELPVLRLTIDAAVYHIDWTDIQLSFRVPVTNFVYVDNASAAKSDGVELTTTLEPASGLAIQGAFSYANARLSEDFPPTSSYIGRTGDRLPFTSEIAGALSMQQTFPLSIGSGFVSATASYVGDRKGIFVGSLNRQDLPAYGKLDLQTGVRTDAWMLTIFANNVTDTRGILNGGVGYFFPPARLYITPRTIGLNISRAF